MALTPNRPEIVAQRQWPPPDYWCQGVGQVSLYQQWYDHPFPPISILLAQTVTTTDQNGQLIHRAEEEWTYDETTRAKVQYVKRTYARVWLPGVNHRAGVVLIEAEVDNYIAGDSMFVGNEDCSRRKTVSGYVIYNQYPAAAAYTPSELAALAAMGVKVQEGYIAKEILSTGRKVSAAVPEQKIVEKEDSSQVAIWRERIEVEEIFVEEDFDKIVTTTYRKNYLQATPPTVTRTEKRKRPEVATLPVALEPPRIGLQSAAAAGVRVAIEGGGAKFTSYQGGTPPAPFEQTLVPEKYLVFRRTVSGTPTPSPNDPMALDPTRAAIGARGLARLITVTASRDHAGNAKDPVPGVTVYTEPGSPDAPPVERWTQVGEAPVTDRNPDIVPKAVYTDGSVTDGLTYEYFAVSVLGSAQSPESNHARIAYSGPLNGGGAGLKVVTRTRKDGTVEIEATAPLRALEAVLLAQGYGETAIFRVPAAPPTKAAADQLGKDVGERQFVRSGQSLEVRWRPPVPILSLERGQLVTLPAAVVSIYGPGLELDAALVPGQWFVNGWSWRAQRSGDGLFVMDVGDVLLEEP